MPSLMKLASMGSALQEVKTKFPNLSVSEAMKALKKSKGDPAKAMELLKPLFGSDPGAAAAGSVVPDLQSDPKAWFQHYDVDGNGLDKHEVIEAVCETFSGANRAHVLDIVQGMWSTFDTDGSGTISLKEFLQPNGLRDTLLATLGGTATGSGRPNRPAAHLPGPMSAIGGYPATPMGRPNRTPPFHAGHADHAEGLRHGGRQRALLIGINYHGTRAQLRGCINDVKNIHNLLTGTFGWDRRSIRSLTDDVRTGPSNPTRSNIEAALRWLVDGARPGDALFFHFSGHGAQQVDRNGFEEDGMNETILPVDFKSAGMITDDQISQMIVQNLPEGVRLTAVMDCCHSGTGMDLPFAWTKRGWKEETNPLHSAADVQLFSGCEDCDTSADASTIYGASGGAMTTAFCDTLRTNPCLTYPDLMRHLNMLLKRRGFRQVAQLTSTQRFDMDRPFLLADAVPNSNPRLGRIVRKKFPPRARKINGPLADMLGLGAAVGVGAVGGLALAGMAEGLLESFFD